MEKLNSSVNQTYGRIPLTSKSIDKNRVSQRGNPLDIKAARPSKEKFNQSIVTKSKDKTHRNKANSSFHYNQGRKKENNPDISNLMDDFPMKGKKGVKKSCGPSVKSEHPKVVRNRRF